jgi:hypothetical protein
MLDREKVLKARPLNEGSSYEARTLQAVFQAVDEAWSEIAHHFGSDPKTIDKARMRLARAFLIVCSEDSDAHHQERCPASNGTGLS